MPTNATHRLSDGEARACKSCDDDAGKMPAVRVHDDFALPASVESKKGGDSQHGLGTDAAHRIEIGSTLEYGMSGVAVGPPRRFHTILGNASGQRFTAARKNRKLAPWCAIRVDGRANGRLCGSAASVCGNVDRLARQDDQVIPHAG